MPATRRALHAAAPGSGRAARARRRRGPGPAPAPRAAPALAPRAPRKRATRPGGSVTALNMSPKRPGSGRPVRGSRARAQPLRAGARGRPRRVRAPERPRSTRAIAASFSATCQTASADEPEHQRQATRRPPPRSRERTGGARRPHMRRRARRRASSAGRRQRGADHMSVAERDHERALRRRRTAPDREGARA